MWKTNAHTEASHYQACSHQYTLSPFPHHYEGRNTGSAFCKKNQMCFDDIQMFALQQNI